MNTNSTSGMIELLTAHWIEFNDRIIVVEESEMRIRRSSLKSLIVSIESTSMS